MTRDRSDGVSIGNVPTAAMRMREKRDVFEKEDSPTAKELSFKRSASEREATQRPNSTQSTQVQLCAPTVMCSRARLLMRLSVERVLDSMLWSPRMRVFKAEHSTSGDGRGDVRVIVSEVH